VANLSVDRPTLYVDRAHFRQKITDEVRSRRGVARGAPGHLSKVGELRINEATITYVDDAEFPPLNLSDANIRARNIRNIRSRERTYPSSIEADAVALAQDEFPSTATPTS
jgi:hypothetical protein